jgi:hypothetical protein
MHKDLGCRVWGLPSCLHATWASSSPHSESHTAPHIPSRYTSTRPQPVQDHAVLSIFGFCPSRKTLAGGGRAREQEIRQSKCRFSNPMLSIPSASLSVRRASSFNAPTMALCCPDEMPTHSQACGWRHTYIAEAGNANWGGMVGSSG